MKVFHFTGKPSKTINPKNKTTVTFPYLEETTSAFTSSPDSALL
jgi:hypothetical protein